MWRSNLVGTENGLMMLVEGNRIFKAPVAGVFKSAILEKDSSVWEFHCSYSIQVEWLLKAELEVPDCDKADCD